MKKSVLIIEDDAQQSVVLRQLVLSAGKNVEIYTADTVALAYRILLEKTIDVFVVDIMLDTSKKGDVSGAKLVERLRRIPKYMFTPVIFVTALEDPAMYAYTDLKCIGYVEKPFDPLQIMQLLEKALNYTTVKEKDISLHFRKDGILYPIKLREIVYMESMNHVMYIHVANGAVLEIPYKTCKSVLQEEDTANCLLQCSRGMLVNREFIRGIDMVNKILMLKAGFGMVNIGGRYKKKLLAEFCG